MITEIREMMSKIKNIDSPINEGVFKCDINDVYKAVQKHVYVDMGFPQGSVTVELRDGDGMGSPYIYIARPYSTKGDTSWNTLNDQQKVERVKQSARQFEQYFAKFKNFCSSGVRSVTTMFNKEVNYITTNSTAQLDAIRYDDRKVCRYTENGVSVLSDYDTYVRQADKNNLDIVYVSVGMFMEDANR